MRCDDGGASDVMYIAASVPLEVLGLRNAMAEGEPAITTAVVTVVGTRVDDDTEIQGVPWPITLVYEAETDRYINYMPPEALLTHNDYYKFVFTAVYGGLTEQRTIFKYAIDQTL